MNQIKLGIPLPYPLNGNTRSDPTHYQRGKMSVEEFLMDQKFNYLEASIVKYICRYPFKDSALKDLNKALDCISKLISIEERKLKEVQPPTYIQNENDCAQSPGPGF